MLIATGTVLVLLTWTVGVLLLSAMGMVLALAAERDQFTWSTVRRSLWWGLLSAAVLASAVAVVAPLRSWTASVVVVAAAALGLTLAALARRRRGSRLHLHVSRRSIAVLVGLGASVVVFAVSALGPVTNYDSGLYHLGAIAYSIEYPSIRGLANLYGPLGYGTSEFTLAALLGNGPLGSDGWRVLNGLIIVLASVDLSLRVLRRRWSAGTYVLLVGLTVAVVPLLVMADYWVTSPTQDSAVFIGTVCASAYLADGLTRRRGGAPDLANALVIATLLVMVRPTMLVYGAGVLVVAVVRVWHGRRSSPGIEWRRATGVVAAGMVIAGVVMVIRDYLLSGWVLYPLSLGAFDVEWRAVDPSELRNATLGFWRDRDDIWGSVDGWAWVGPWLTRSIREWEAIMLAVLLVVTVALVSIAVRSTTLRGRALVGALVPSAMATAVWWLASPPGFRFAWGPLVTLGSIPIGWALWRLAGSAATTRALPRVAPTASAVALVSVSAFALVGQTPWQAFDTEAHASIGPVSVSYAHAPVFLPRTREGVTDSGLRLVVPVATDQCWQVFPLCSPLASSTLRLRGPDLADGFLP